MQYGGNVEKDWGYLAASWGLGLALSACLQGMVTVAHAAEPESDEFLEFLETDDSAPPAQPDSTPPPQDTSPAAQNPEAAATTAEPELDVITLPKKEAPPASAETRAPPSSRSIEAIVVTAQRREEDLQDVPISITVFSQEEISKANMTTSADIARYTPSLSANTRFGTDNATFTIRGFTQDLRTTASVGTYFAEVVAPRGQSTQTSGDGAGPGTLFDLQNIQVLKGPQGTLFGRNTTGGAILIVPRKPTDEFEGYAEFTGAELGGLRGQSVVNYPVSEDFRIRLGIDHNERDGLLRNVSGIGPDELANLDYTAGRLSLVWDITDTVENYMIGSLVNSDTNGSTSQLYACNDLLSNLSNPGDYDVQALINGLADLIASGGDVDLTNPLPGVPLGGSPLGLLTYQACQQQLADQQAAGNAGRFDVVNDMESSTLDIKERRVINTTTWSLSDDLTFKNIFAYAHLLTENGSNVFGNRFPDSSDPTGTRVFGIGHSIPRTDMPVTNQETWVEEMQLQGNAFDSRLIWQAGAYYEHSQPDGFSGNSSVALVYCEIASIETNDPAQYNCYDPLNGIVGEPYRYKVRTEYLNQAVFAQGTYTVADPFSVTLGLRYTWDETEGHGVKEFYPYYQNVQQAPEITVQKPKLKSTAPTGFLEFDFRPFEGTMTYAKYTRGYRQGTVNMLADPGLDTHQPETVDTYEVGLKSTFGGLVPGRFNIALFDNTLTDMQLQGGYVSTTSGPTTAIFNAGEGTSRGLEIESYFQPFETLSLSLSYSFLDTKLVKSADFCSRVEEVGYIEGFTCTPIAEAGDELPFAPNHTYIANLNWTLPLPEHWGRVDFGGTYAYTGEQRVAATSSSPFAVLDGFGLLNLNLGWTGILETDYDLNLFATNVLDKEYVVFTSGTYRPLGIESRNVGAARFIGARLRYNF
ncbi:MAG: TonB-dependent receptor [Sinimarinibacterium sp.]|jgi:outer membrane receptor protein involved in Fe transport